MVRPISQFQNLFFALGKNSVRDYYREVSHNIAGEVVGPFRMPLKLVDYTHGQSGIGPVEPNARTIARAAAVAANPSVDFGL